MSSFIHADPGGATVNHSGKTLHGNPNPPYDVHEGPGDPPNGYALLAAPGSPVPADYVARYKLADKLKPAEGHEAPGLVSSSGEPLIMVGGRAVAESLVPESMRPKPAGKPGQPGPKQGVVGVAGPQPGQNVAEAGRPSLIEGATAAPGNPAKK